MSAADPRLTRWLTASVAATLAGLERDWLAARAVRLGFAPNLVLSVLPCQLDDAVWLQLHGAGRVDGALQADAACLPFPDACFGNVLLQHAYEFGRPAEPLLAEAARVLMPGGRLLLAAFNPFAWSAWRRRRPGFAARPRLQGALAVRRQLQALGLSCAPTEYLPWPDSWLEAHLPAALQAIYFLAAAKRPPGSLPVAPLPLPAGAVAG